MLFDPLTSTMYTRNQIKTKSKQLDNIYTTQTCFCVYHQALEEEFARKLQEQEVFFKMSGESECLNPSTQSRISKFYPIPSVHSTGFQKKPAYICSDVHVDRSTHTPTVETESVLPCPHPLRTVGGCKKHFCFWTLFLSMQRCSATSFYSLCQTFTLLQSFRRRIMKEIFRLCIAS